MRVQKLASLICQSLEDAGVKVRPGIVHKAALLAKTDLTTELVKEFTELQGIVGGLYARAQQLDRNLNDDQPTPSPPPSTISTSRSPWKTRVPRTLEGAVLAIADKADTIAGMFALGLQPTGSKDPFALRRQANGIVKTIAEHKLPLSLRHLCRTRSPATKVSEAEARRFSAVAPGTRRKRWPASSASAGVLSARRARLCLRCRERRAGRRRRRRGGCGGARPGRRQGARLGRLSSAICRRLQAHQEHLAAGAREGNCRTAPLTFERLRPLATEPEKSYCRARAGTCRRRASTPSIARAADYADALTQLSTLRGPVDNFFDKVMVMVEDERVTGEPSGAAPERCCDDFSTIADFTEIVTEGRGS